MKPFTIKPGETVTGMGINFISRLAADETLTSTTATASTGLTVTACSVSGTIAAATVAAAADLIDSDLSITFTATGNAGSVRKATRSILVRATE